MYDEKKREKQLWQEQLFETTNSTEIACYSNA